MIKFSQFDSDIFGYKCGFLELEKTDSNDYIANLVNKAKSENYHFLTAKIDSKNIDLINSCLINKGKFIDTELTFQKTFNNQKQEINLHDGFHIKKEINNEQLEKLLNLSELFKDSRFYRDTKVNQQKANQLWRTSIKNHIENHSTMILFQQETPIGFLISKIKNTTSDIFLIGIDDKYQKMGLAKELIKYYENNLTKEIKYLTVETQAINYPAQKLYANLGYNVVKSKSIIHFWL